MSEHGMNTSNMCEFGEGVVERFKKFRFRKDDNSAAIILKINKDSKTIEIEEDMEDVSMEEVAEELPERSPRFIGYSYRKVHDDGRKSYPLCFINYSPEGCNPNIHMLYTGSTNMVVNTLKFPKVFDAREKEVITEDWLKDKLGKA